MDKRPDDCVKALTPNSAQQCKMFQERVKCKVTINDYGF